MRRRGWIRSALAGAAVVGLLAGCSSNGGDSDHPTIDRVPAAPAPAVTVAPAGSVTPSAAITQLLSEPATGTLVEVTDGANALQLNANGTTRTVALPAKPASLALGKPGEVLVAVPGKVIRVDVATGTTSEIGVDGDVLSAALRPDGTLAVGLANGKVLLLDANGAVQHTISGLVSADAVDASDNHVVVLDQRQTTITQLDLPAHQLGLSLRAGDGATHMIGDHFGRRLVTDTKGGELLVYTADPLVLHQRFPVGSSPYALAYDQRSETVWVTLTGRNEVVGYDLSTGIPVEVGRYPTVRQPNTVTIDSRTGDMFVGSGTGDGLQRIPADQRKRGQ
ncbi:YncE family protein [Nocardia sp. NPDC020380]|uniref:YncE family protein n=1 Tax=Nocardia sp. NPDC020380 TaxID=3364309 RepID=UPI0037BD8E0F